MRSTTLYREEFIQLARLSWPVIISQVGVMMMGLVDSFVVGRYSSLELAGVAAGNSIFWTVVMIGLGLLNGMDPIVSQAHGRGDHETALRCLGASLQQSLLFSLLLGPFLYFISSHLDSLGATPEVARAAAPYLGTLGLSLLPLMFAAALQRYWQCLELVLPFTLIIIGANVLNLVLDLMFVTGRWGFPALGAQGVALATTGCRFFILFASLLVSWRAFEQRGIKAAAGLSLRRLFTRIDRAMHEKFLRLALPAASQMVLEVTAFSLTTLLMARLGAETLAAHHIVLSMASFTFMFPLGISAATATRVGYHSGRSDVARAFASGWLGMGAGVGVMLISALGFFTIPDLLLRLFTEDKAVIELSLSVLFLCALFQIFDGLQVVSAGALRGLGDTKTALYANLFSHWLVGLPLGITLCFYGKKGLSGLWTGLALGLFCTALINTYFWQKRARRVLSPSAQTSS